MELQNLTDEKLMELMENNQQERDKLKEKMNEIQTELMKRRNNLFIKEVDTLVANFNTLKKDFPYASCWLRVNDEDVNLMDCKISKYDFSSR